MLLSVKYFGELLLRTVHCHFLSTLVEAPCCAIRRVSVSELFQWLSFLLAGLSSILRLQHLEFVGQLDAAQMSE